jgi:hypothetical protein
MKHGQLSGGGPPGALLEAEREGVYQDGGGDSTVLADGFHWAAIHGFLAEGFFFRRFWLLENKRMSAIVVAGEIGRSGFSAQIAIDALIIHIEFAAHIVGVFVVYVCHNLKILQG